MRYRATLTCLGLALFAIVGLAPAAGADEPGWPDWESYRDVDIIEVLTVDEDGDPRETKVWFVLLGGEPFLRTNGTHWLENLRRDPELGLRIEGHEYVARAEEIQGDEIVGKVDEASRRKYGWQEAVIHVFRMKKPDILRLVPRGSTPAGAAVGSPAP